MATDQFKINLTDRIKDGVAGFYGYQDTITNPYPPPATLPNPESQFEFVKRILKANIKSHVVQHEGKDAKDDAEETAEAEVEIEDV